MDPPMELAFQQMPFEGMEGKFKIRGFDDKIVLSLGLAAFLARNLGQTE